MTSRAKNLEAIDQAIRQHNFTCPFPVSAIRMNFHEVERLGFDDFKGIPILPTDTLPTGRFKLICSQGKDEEHVVEESKVAA